MKKENVVVLAKGLADFFAEFSTSDATVLLDAAAKIRPEIMQAMVGVIWHVGEEMDASKAVIQRTKKGIQLSYAAKRGGSLQLPESKSDN